MRNVLVGKDPVGDAHPGRLKVGPVLRIGVLDDDAIRSFACRGSFVAENDHTQRGISVVLRLQADFQSLWIVEFVQCASDLATLGIGAVAGLYPAMRAARLSPTEALRTI